ncbi:MAG: hypothetical protein AABX93_02320 [Nanoarchaeota archaeon]
MFFREIKKFFLGEDLVVWRLRKFLKQLYRGYPLFVCYGYDRLHRIDEGVETLIEDNLIKFISEDQNGKNYRITGEGLKLVDSWTIEDLTYSIILLTLFQILLIINLK